MRQILILAALLISIRCYSQAGSPPTTGATVPPPCLSLTQRVRLGDSLAMLPRVRRAAVEYRTAATLAVRQKDEFGNALVAQQRLTTQATATAADWKGKARRRGLLNWLFIATAGSLTYLFVR